MVENSAKVSYASIGSLLIATSHSARVLLLLSIVSVSAAGGPGNYAHYTWPATPAGSSATSMDVTHVWTTLPTSKDVVGNAVFASTQHWYQAGPGGTLRAIA